MNAENAGELEPCQAGGSPQRVGRFEWEHVIRSAQLAKPAGGRRPKASLPLVALTLATYANPDGSNVFPSQGRVAKGHGISTDTVRRALRDLEALGYLLRVREATATRGAEYVLTLPQALVPPSPGTDAQTPWDMCQDLPAPVPSDQSSTNSAPEHSPSQSQISPTTEVDREPIRWVGTGEPMNFAARDEARRAGRKDASPERYRPRYVRS
jgi:hypothetical protein